MTLKAGIPGFAYADFTHNGGSPPESGSGEWDLMKTRAIVKIGRLPNMERR